MARGGVRELVERHLEIPQRVAVVIYPRVRQHVTFNELLAFANEGLIEAATRFDPERGVSFATFAWYRVNGAIIDELRRATQLPRKTWAKLVALRAASDIVTGSQEQSEIRRAISQIRTRYPSSLEAMRERGFDVGEMPELDRQLDTHKLTVHLHQAIGALPSRERDLITKHYWEGKNLLEVGEEMGMSKSWACRMHAQAVGKLRSKLAYLDRAEISV